MQELSKATFIKSINDYIKLLFRKTLNDATEQQLYQAVAYAVKELVMDDWMETHKMYEEKDVKTVYYLSMEFLMGRTLGNMLMNMGAYSVVQEALRELGIDLNLIENEEKDPALGNGGLGRLAACFLDSLATRGYAAYGCGIRYKYGMFEQKIKDGYQMEVPDEWLKHGYPFEMKRTEYATLIKFGGYVRMERRDDGKDYFIQEACQSVLAIPYDIPIVGYQSNIVNTLRIWDAQPVQNFNLDSFDKGDYIKAVEQENLARTICEVLYPNDQHYAGKELRLKQQYFFVSASVQRAVVKYMKHHKDIHRLFEKVVFQMNDTHPAVAVAELMRILLDEYYLPWEEAWEITTKTCAYTNHTIMTEALEKWPIELFQSLLPRIYQIVEEIDRRYVLWLKSIYPNDSKKVEDTAVLYNGQVRMAYLAVIGSFSVNGVARLHTEILKHKVLRTFYEIMPYKFNNKTNGITQRRFLLHGNPKLATWITDKIGDDWITELTSLKQLEQYAANPEAQEEFMRIKYENKVRLAEYIKLHNGIHVDPNSVYDVQAKRLHEYKRQLLNIMHIMHLYQQMKENPNLPFHKRTFIFGAKASAGYRRAKAIIKLINCVADVINNDPLIQDKIKVVFIENYGVSIAELIFSAADVSEQISTASKEASGTGNMKFMLNGALTIGTMDGANVEIVEEVGKENAFIFGLSAVEVLDYEKNHNYRSQDILNSDCELRSLVEQLVDGTYTSEKGEGFYELYDALVKGNCFEMADQYFVLKDFREYEAAQTKVSVKYNNQSEWAKAAILNVANCGKFSSDRTIEEYVKDIWKCEKVKR